MEYPIIFTISKGNINFLIKACVLIEGPCHQFHVSAFFNQKQYIYQIIKLIYINP